MYLVPALTMWTAPPGIACIALSKRSRESLRKPPRRESPPLPRSSCTAPRCTAPVISQIPSRVSVLRSGIDVFCADVFGARQDRYLSCRCPPRRQTSTCACSCTRCRCTHLHTQITLHTSLTSKSHTLVAASSQHINVYIQNFHPHKKKLKN
jgi:hypothetical protein